MIDVIVTFHSQSFAHINIPPQQTTATTPPWTKQQATDQALHKRRQQRQHLPPTVGQDYAVVNKPKTTDKEDAPTSTSTQPVAPSVYAVVNKPNKGDKRERTVQNRRVTPPRRSQPWRTTTTLFASAAEENSANRRASRKRLETGSIIFRKATLVRPARGATPQRALPL